MSDAKNQAKAQLASVCAMVAALECDYDRIEELRDEREFLEAEYLAAFDAGKASWPGDIGATHPTDQDWNEAFDSGRELAELESVAGDCEDEDDARQRIEDDALSVEVRSNWETPGAEMTASEYRIVLCTGGPHCEIVGDLGRYGEPESARLLYSDWFTGKQEYICDSDEQAALLTYARQFYFGQ